MKRLLLFLALLAPPAWAQNPVSYLQIPPQAADPFTCDSTRYGAVYRNTVGDVEWVCRSTGWQKWGTGSAPGFPLLGTAGSAGAPTYSFAGDPNTGIYNSAANTIGFAVDGDLRLSLSPTALALRGNRFFCFNGTDYPCLQFATNQTPNAFVLTTPSANNLLLFLDAGNEGVDHAFPAQTHPSLVLFAADSTTSDYVLLQHNSTDAVLATGGGAIKFESPSGFKYDRTLTAAGTTGAQTINTTRGSVNFAAGASTLVVTNSQAATTSLIFVTALTNDATCWLKDVERAAGSFTIRAVAACTGETVFGFAVEN